MTDSIVAYRYAKSLIDLASEMGIVEEVNKDMNFFKQVADENPQFKAVMANPIIRHEQKLNILKKIFENKVNPVTFSVLNILTKKNRESLIEPIADEYRVLYNRLNNIQIATVITVEPLTSKQQKEFEEIVAKATGKKVELKEKIDNSLIGGYILRVGDSQIDTSIRKKLNDLKLSLN